VPISITSYDATRAQAASVFLPSHVSDQAFAYPWEGFVFQGQVVAGGGGGDGTATNSNNGGAGTTTKDKAGNSPTATGGSGSLNTGGSTAKEGTTGTSDIPQTTNTGSNLETGTGSAGNGETLPSKTSGGTGNGIMNGGATSTITTTSSPNTSLAGPGKISSGTVAAIVIGTILALLLLLAIVLFMLSYRQRKVVEKNSGVHIDVYNTSYHSYHWWLAPFIAGSNRRHMPNGDGRGTLVRSARRWPGWRGEERESTYHELEGQKNFHGRTNAAELHDSTAERPITYEMEARITNV
jgi:hypothetical protein